MLGSVVIPEGTLRTTAAGLHPVPRDAASNQPLGDRLRARVESRKGLRSRASANALTRTARSQSRNSSLTTCSNGAEDEAVSCVVLASNRIIRRGTEGSPGEPAPPVKLGVRGFIDLRRRLQRQGRGTQSPARVDIVLVTPREMLKPIVRTLDPPSQVPRTAATDGIGHAHIAAATGGPTLPASSAETTKVLPGNLASSRWIALFGKTTLRLMCAPPRRAARAGSSQGHGARAPRRRAHRASRSCRDRPDWSPSPIDRRVAKQDTITAIGGQRGVDLECRRGWLRPSAGRSR